MSGDAGVAVVTGSSGGIGAGIATVLGARGWSVVVNYHANRDRAEAVVATVRESGGDAIAVGADATDPEGVQRLVDAALDRFGRIDGAVANAHVPFTPAPLAETEWSDLVGKIGGEVGAAFHLTRACVPPMRAQGGGSLVFLSSLQTRGPAAPGMVANGSAKAAVEAFARYAAWELGADGIRVNTVGSSFVQTAATAHLPEAFSRTIERATALRRLGEPEDVGRTVAFLLGPDGAYTTGVDLPSAGGFGLSFLPETRDGVGDPDGS